MHSPFTLLLPLYGLSVTLKFLTHTEFNYFHQMTIDGFIRYLLDNPHDYSNCMTSESSESGRIYYDVGDTYRFSLISFAGKKQHYVDLFNMLQKLPESAPINSPDAPLRDNIKLDSLIDLIDGKPIHNVSGLDAFGVRQLIDISHQWQNESTTYPRTISFQWLSPVRFLLESDLTRHTKAENKFCHALADLTPRLLVKRIIESLFGLMETLGHKATRFEDSVYDQLPLTTMEGDLFWLDTPYHNEGGEADRTGGMVGYITLTQTGSIPHGIWQGLILGQYLGVGHRRDQGFGKYQLTLQGISSRTLPIRYGRSQSLLSQMLSKRHLDKAILLAEDKNDNHQLSTKQLAQVNSAIGQIQHGDYHPPPLFAQLIPKKDGSMRTLAVAPLFDRVLQKAAALVISPCVDAILYHRSYAYRKGRSRQQARYDIQQAYQEGYRWIYESDVDDFFDAIDRDQLIKRLTAIFGHDPLFPFIQRWLSSDVILNGQRIERKKGIPQGSPLSPVLANFILDDFDTDLESRGFRLVRFADDFIILCKSRIEAELAAEQVKNSLAELGLSINQEKSHIVSLEQGFKFLGYLFQNEWAVDIGGNADATQTHAKNELPANAPAWLAALGAEIPTSIEEQHNEDIGLIGRMNQEGSFLTIAGESSMLSLENAQVVISQNDVITYSIPLGHLAGILLFGNHHLTTPLMKACLSEAVPVHFADRMGHYEGALWKRQPIDHSYKGWFVQLQHFDNEEFALILSKATVESRLHNMQRKLQRHHKRPVVLTALKKIVSMKQKVTHTQNLKRLLGIEGIATREYFAALADILPDWCEFKGRNRRPPKDPFNVLLSYGFTWLYAHADSILQSHGFLTWKGYYHQTSSGHAALASDVIESYRHLIEHAALKAVNMRMIQLDDFRYENDHLRLGSDGRRNFIRLLEKEFMRPIQEQTPWQHLHQQAKSLWSNTNHHAPYVCFKET